MEHPEQTQSGISSVWKIALGTILFATLTAASWHQGGMRDVHARERNAIQELEQKAALLSGYSESIKKDGIVGGAQYLKLTPVSHVF